MTSVRDTRPDPSAFAATIQRLAVGVAIPMLVLGVLAGGAAADSGPVVAWGASGEAGSPDSVNGRAGTAWAIAAGNGHSCAIQAGSSAVVCWGLNSFGQATPPPSVNGTAGTASAITAGGHHGCAIQAGSGAVVCWGGNDTGQAIPPDSVNGTTGTASAIAAGQRHNCAIQTSSGAVVCWGGNFDFTPDSVNGGTGTASAIATGAQHSCAIRAGSGAVVCWGDNSYGQVTPPRSVNGTTGTASAIAAGAAHSCAIQAGSGAVVCWGLNSLGQATPPPSVNGTTGIASAIAAGAYQSCAIQAGSGAVVCWTEYNAAIPPASVNGIGGTASAIAVGLEHALAIRTPECSDGFDLDGDGAVGYPADPGCDSPSDSSERDPALICDDGIDNDGDRSSDYPSDLGCDSSIDASEKSAALACDDGLDDDGDGLTDFPSDSGCESPSDPSENRADLVCDDGIDNDGDGLVDYPSDPNCRSRADPSEYSTACEDGIDNDGDGSTDYWADPGCTWFEDESETSDIACDNDIDDDGDGRVDYPDDRNCASARDRSESPDQCDDGIDNDGNGLVDYPADPSCTGFNDDSEFVAPASFVSEEVLLVGDFYNFTPALTVGRDGNVYGTTPLTIFRIDGAGVLTTVHTFSAEDSWGGPARLVVGQDGLLYGFTGKSDYGTEYSATHGVFFRLDYQQGYTRLLSLPYTLASDLALGSDGAFYAGIAIVCGAEWCRPSPGTIKITSAGDYTVVERADVPLVYPNPNSPLALGSDGALYGVTPDGGEGEGNGAGTVYRVDPDGTVTTVHVFDYADAFEPRYELLLAKDGALYGVTHGWNAAFRVDSLGTVTYPRVLPGYPTSSLVQGNDCALYGTAAHWDPTAGYRSVVYRLFEPGHLCQGLHLEPLPDRTFGDAPFSVSATSSSGLPVSFTASGSCSVTDDQVTLTGVGLCTLMASQAGDADYEPAPEVSRSFDVLFDFNGFLRPVMNPPVVNRVKAGRAVPIRFSLGGDQGRDVLAEGSPEVRPVPCDASAPVNDIRGLVTKRPRSFRYAPKRDRYTVVWKTDKSWAGSCQEFALELIDGSVHRATFRFEPLRRPHGRRGEAGAAGLRQATQIQPPAFGGVAPGDPS